MTNWIKVEDQLPRIGQAVLVFYETGIPSVAELFQTTCDGCHTIAWRIAVVDGDSFISGKSVTHWMPLPELPEVKNEI